MIPSLAAFGQPYYDSVQQLNRGGGDFRGRNVPRNILSVFNTSVQPVYMRWDFKQFCFYVNDMHVDEELHRHLQRRDVHFAPTDPCNVRDRTRQVHPSLFVEL